MVLILGLYMYLLRKEKMRAKRAPVLGYEDKKSNLYSQKLKFLDNQDVSVSQL